MNELAKSNIMLHAYRMGAKTLNIANGIYLADDYTSTPSEIKKDFYDTVNEWVVKMKKKRLRMMRDERDFITGKMNRVRDCEELQILSMKRDKLKDEIEDMKN